MLSLLLLFSLALSLIWIASGVYLQNPIAWSIAGVVLFGLLIKHIIHALRVKHKALQPRKDKATPTLEPQTQLTSLTESTWIAQACHDLRQPTMASSLSITAAKALTEDASLVAHLDVALEASDELNRKIQNILDFSELSSDSRPMDMKPVNIRQVFNDIRIQFSETAQVDVGLRFRCRDDFALGHAPWIARVLQNLIANALQHAGAQRILVTARRQRGFIHLSVHDDGVGMSPSKIIALLLPTAPTGQPTKSRNTDKASRSKDIDSKNYGLGILIALRYTRSLGSELQLHSRPDYGARFHFALAAADATMETPPAAVHNLSELRHNKLDLHILLLTDHQELMTSLLPVLQASSKSVTLRGVAEFMEHGLSAAFDAEPVSVVVLEDHSRYLSATAFDLTYLLRSELGNEVQAIWIVDPHSQQQSSAHLPPLTQLIQRPLLASSVLQALQKTIEKP